MALPRTNTLKEVNLDCHLASVTVSGATAAAYVPMPFEGRIVRLYGAQGASVSGSPTTVTVSKIDPNGTAQTIGTIVMATGASRAGYVTQSADISALGVGAAEGDVIRFLSDGASDDVTVASTFTAVVKRGGV